MKPALTVGQVMDAFDKILDRRPEAADWPVHIMDMDDHGDNNTVGLVTTVEIDMFDQEQGLVVSLLAWPTQEGE